MSLGVREAAMQAIVDLFQAVQVGYTPDPDVSDPYTHQWGTVQRDPLGEADSVKDAVLAVLDPSASVDTKFNYTDKIINVVLEFRVRRKPGVAGHTQLNQIMDEMEHQLCVDRTLGGTAYDVRFVSTEKLVDDKHDRALEGVLVVEVYIRHGQDDPRRAM